MVGFLANKMMDFLSSVDSTDDHSAGSPSSMIKTGIMCCVGLAAMYTLKKGYEKRRNLQKINKATTFPIVRKVLNEALIRTQSLSKTHYSYYHGISSAWGIYNYVAAQLFQSNEPQYDRSQHEFSFRGHSTKLTSLADVQTLVTDAAKELLPGQDLYANGSFHDAYYKGQLLSVSPYLLDVSGAESAGYFLSHNSSMSHPFEEHCEQLLLDHLGNTFKAKNLLRSSGLSKDLKNLIDKEHNPRANGLEGGTSESGGMLAVFSVPKDLVVTSDPARQQVYRSHRGGIPCDCYDSSQDKRIAESFQKSVLSESLCKSGMTLQYRIITTGEIRKRMISKVIDCAPAAVTKAWQEAAKNFVKKVQKLKLKLDEPSPLSVNSQ